MLCELLVREVQKYDCWMQILTLSCVKAGRTDEDGGANEDERVTRSLEMCM